MVTVEVYAPGGFEDSVHLQQPDGEETQERGDVLAVAVARCLDDLEEGSVLVLDLIEPDRVDFVPRPLVREYSSVAPLPVVDVEAGGPGAVALGVEWWVGGD